MESLNTIAAEVRACVKCRLSETRTIGVPGEGSPNAEIFFIGEGPGFHEDQQGRPFVGAAGQLLVEMLREIGLRREEVFITNVVRCRPPGNRDPWPDELAACDDYSQRQIAALEPKVIVTLGRYSMARFFPGAKISAIHGQAKKVDGRVVVAMYHPAAALHQQSLRQTVVDDFKRSIPPALAEARRMEAEGKLGSKSEKKDGDDEPPKQLSLF
jgi:DNA polymerase